MKNGLRPVFLVWLCSFFRLVRASSLTLAWLDKSAAHAGRIVKAAQPESIGSRPKASHFTLTTRKRLTGCEFRFNFCCGNKISNMGRLKTHANLLTKPGVMIDFLQMRDCELLKVIQ
jgi:hypothetical protein